MTRRPREAPPERIAPLATLPVFFKLHGKKALLAGATAGALWKAELLAAAGVALEVYAPGNAGPFHDLAARLSPRNTEGYGQITVHDRSWTAADLGGMALAIGDCENDAEALALRDAARDAGVPVNIVDRPEFCDFQFGSIVNRSPLVISISTDGAAPVFGQAIRARIEAILPKNVALWANAARAWRPAVQARSLAYSARRLFWETFTARAMRDPTRAPDDADRAACFAAIDAAEKPKGRVLLVGAGPGDASLLTLRAVQALQSADVILFDDLVSAEVLDLARREAERIGVGKTGHAPSCAQADITALMVKLALEGRRVVRLKGGDPMIFGRATEELDAARDAGVAIEVVPGISAAQAAAASLGISLTERKIARRVQFITGHDVHGELPDDLDWRSIADPNVSTAVYMPRGSLAKLATMLEKHGMPKDTPAIAIASISRAGEESVASTLEGLPELAAALGKGPMLVLLGAAFRRGRNEG